MNTQTTLISPLISEPLIKLAKYMGQATDQVSGNLGFGYLYYGLVRLFRPETVVCIGSYRGFSPVCLALALRDNNKGQCYFIDPGKVDDYWHKQDNIEHLKEVFNIGNCFNHIFKTTQQVIEERIISEVIDLLLIDGDHSYNGVKFDFTQLGKQVAVGGFILLHDSIADGEGFTKWEVKRFLEEEIFGKPGFEQITFPFDTGLTILRKID